MVARRTDLSKIHEQIEILQQEVTDLSNETLRLQEELNRHPSDSAEAAALRNDIARLEQQVVELRAELAARLNPDAERR